MSVNYVDPFTDFGFKKIFGEDTGIYSTKNPFCEQKGHYYEQSWKIPAKKLRVHSIISSIHQKLRSGYARSAEPDGLRSDDVRSYAPIVHP